MQKTGDQCIWYTYDESGNLSGLRVGNSEYYYYRNGQGDIIGIIDGTGSIAAKYSYDAWGTPIAITDGAGNDVSGNVSHIANINPFRYRGYFYDVETGLYYLQSRYYDPQVGRFLNADGYVSTGQGIHSTNMFMYCGNIVINKKDSSGNMMEFCIWMTSKEGIEWQESLKKQDPVVVGSLSPWGEPNSHVDDYSDGYHKERWYGTDGKAVKDRHHTDHNNPKHHTNPHDQDWDWSDPEHPTLGPGYPPTNEKAINWEPIAGIGIVVVSVVGFIWVVGNDITGVGAADDGALVPLWGLFSKGLQMIA